MNKLAVLSLLPLIVFSSGAQAQQMSVVTFTSAAAEPAPANAHEYALQEFKESYDYASRNRVPDQFFMVHMSTFTFAGGTKQGFSIDKDGKVTLENMTLEDALLSTVAFQSRESLDRMKGWDRQEKDREERKADKPPDKMKVGPDKWDVHNLPAWSTDDTLLGDTNCANKRIRLLEDGYGKPNSMLHEMLHAATGCSHDLELHRTIYAMTPKLLKMLQENPDLVKYLTTPPVKPADPKKDEVKR